MRLYLFSRTGILPRFTEIWTFLFRTEEMWTAEVSGLFCVTYHQLSLLMIKLTIVNFILADFYIQNNFHYMFLMF